MDCNSEFGITDWFSVIEIHGIDFLETCLILTNDLTIITSLSRKRRHLMRSVKVSVDL